MTSVLKTNFSGRVAGAEMSKDKACVVRSRGDPPKTEKTETKITSQKAGEAFAVDRKDETTPSEKSGLGDKVTMDDSGSAKVLAEFTESLGYNSQNTRLEFSEDPDLERVVVKVVDKETEEVVREIPAEEVLRAAKALRKLSDSTEALKGNLVHIIT